MAKVLVSFNDRLLRRVDRMAAARGLTRSAYLAELAEHDAAREEGPGKSPAARQAMRELDRLFARWPTDESTVAVRAARDAR
jgi:metal-responsive CopG/Arc/MetJ family transcriptional regulator